MRAWRVHRHGGPCEALRLDEIDPPEPGPGQVRIRVSACGVCHTDLHTVEGELSLPRLPLVPGHQIVGRVDAVGPQVEGLAVGERVGVAWLHQTCGSCRFCGDGLENLCKDARFTGMDADGGYAEAMLAPADFVYPLPDGFGDLLVVAPNETRAVGGQVRRGVVYLIFGGTHLYNQIFLLSQVGTTQLPGMIFVSPFAVGTADEATLECAEAAGDVDGDGFGDILIGAPAADFVNPAEPSQRRVDSGEAYLIYGTNAISLIGERSVGACGVSK